MTDEFCNHIADAVAAVFRNDALDRKAKLAKIKEMLALCEDEAAGDDKPGDGIPEDDFFRKNRRKTAASESLAPSRPGRGQVDLLEQWRRRHGYSRGPVTADQFKKRHFRTVGR